MTAHYDFAVVGSSPLLMMMALQLNRAGHSVVLFEKERQLGGAWQVETVDDIGDVECACHLIEWYAGGYKLLSELSGVEFVRSNPQPVRVFPSGRVEPYTTVAGFPSAFYWGVRRLLAAGVRYLIKPASERPMRAETVAESWHDLIFQCRYRLPGIFTYDGIRRPVGGYIRLTQALSSQIEHSDIRVIRESVDHIDAASEHAKLVYADGELVAKAVYIGESTTISSDQPSHLCEPEDYFHLVISLPAAQVRLRSDYVHFPEDPIFHRITYVRDRNEQTVQQEAIFLVQLRKALADIDGFAGELAALLERSGLAEASAEIKIHKEFSKRYMRRSALGRTPNTSSVIHRLRTIGDLSRNLLIHRQDFKSKSI